MSGDNKDLIYSNIRRIEELEAGYGWTKTAIRLHAFDIAFLIVSVYVINRRLQKHLEYRPVITYVDVPASDTPDPLVETVEDDNSDIEA